jgi:SAM-dependent methyltransferase
MSIRVNVGCGSTPTYGWVNLDNSVSVRLGRLVPLVEWLGRIGAMDEDHLKLAKAAKLAGITWANAARRIPLPDGSADVIYASHIVEHLDLDDARAFLGEAWRVLRPSGILRLVVPDLSLFVDRYRETGDADAFVSSLLFSQRRPRSLVERLRLAVIGFRGHRWMYDGPSLVRLLTQCGFIKPVILAAGETTIREPGTLDLSERAEESLYVEAQRG